MAIMSGKVSTWFSSFAVTAIDKKTGTKKADVAKSPYDTLMAFGGEDSCAMCATHAAIADGVGGAGGDSGIFSNMFITSVMMELMIFDKQIASRGLKLEPTAIKEVVKTALDSARNSIPLGNRGASTLCTANLSQDGYALINNVGDSGAMILRRTTVYDFDPIACAMSKKPSHRYSLIYRTQPGTHYFNCPHQISLENGANSIDANMTNIRFPVMNDDLVILASDGVFDNLWDHEIVRIVNHVAREKSDDMDCDLGSVVANAIADGAKARSACDNCDDARLTPFAKEFLREHSMPFEPNGKVDDISVCVGVVAIRAKKSGDDDDMRQLRHATGGCMRRRTQIDVSRLASENFCA